MRPEDTLDDWLKRLTLGDGKAPRLNDRGVAFVTVSGAYSIGVAVNPETRNIGFICFLMPAPEPASAEFLHHLLSMNLALIATRNASLGIDVESGMVVLGRTVPMDLLDAGKFADFFGGTATLADNLRTTINEAAKSIKAGAPAPASAAEDPASHWLKL